MNFELCEESRKLIARLIPFFVVENDEIIQIIQMIETSLNLRRKTLTEAPKF